MKKKEKKNGGEMKKQITNNLIIFCALILIICNTNSNNLSAQEKKVTISIGVISYFEKWNVSRKKHVSIFESNDYWDPETIEDNETDFGLIVGPKIVISLEEAFVRGFYLLGSNKFNNAGKGVRKIFGFDIGYGQIAGGFIGYRSIYFDFSNWQSNNVTDHTVSDVILGTFYGTKPEKTGFNIKFEMIFGLKSLFNVWIDEEKFIKSPAIGEGELNFGYRFKTLPFFINVGYRIWFYSKLDREYKNRAYITPNILETLEHLGHGFTFNVTYNF